MTDRRHPSHYTAPEAAQALGVAHITILRWVAAGKLPCWRTAGQHRRITVEAVESMRQGRTQ